jgi:chromosome segregation ATPase
MKRNLTLTLLTLLLAVASFGQSVKDQLAAIEQEATPLLAQREANKKTLAQLEQTKSDIQFGYDALTKYADKYKNDKAAYDIDLGGYSPQADALNSAMAAHNSNRCTAPADNPGVCAGYNAEANQLNARRAQLETQKEDLDRRKGYLDTTLGQLRELQSVLQAKFEKYTADANAYNEQNNANEAKIKTLADRWNALLNSMGNCFKNLPPAATDEQIHEACGAAWDGNSVGKPAVVNQGTGGITPNN